MPYDLPSQPLNAETKNYVNKLIALNKINIELFQQCEIHYHINPVLNRMELKGFCCTISMGNGCMYVSAKASTRYMQIFDFSFMDKCLVNGAMPVQDAEAYYDLNPFIKLAMAFGSNLRMSVLTKIFEVLEEANAMLTERMDLFRLTQEKYKAYDMFLTKHGYKLCDREGKRWFQSEVDDMQSCIDLDKTAREYGLSKKCVYCKSSAFVKAAEYYASVNTSI